MRADRYNGVLMSLLLLVAEKVRCKRVQFYFSINPLFILLCDVSGEIIQPIFRHFVNLIKHFTVQWYSRRNAGNDMLSEEKGTEVSQC